MCDIKNILFFTNNLLEKMVSKIKIWDWSNEFLTLYPKSLTSDFFTKFILYQM